MLGDVLLRRAEARVSSCDARLAVAEAIEDPDPHRLADDAEAPSDQLDERVGERFEVAARFNSMFDSTLVYLQLYNYTAVGSIHGHVPRVG